MMAAGLALRVVNSGPFEKPTLSRDPGSGEIVVIVEVINAFYLALISNSLEQRHGNQRCNQRGN